MKIATQAGVRRYLVGRRIVSVDLRPFADGRGGTSFNPRIVLDDGSVLLLQVRETEDTSGVELHRESGAVLDALEGPPSRYPLGKS